MALFDHQREEDRIAARHRFAAERLAPVSGDTRADWRELAGLGILGIGTDVGAGMPPGPVTRTVAAVEGIGLAGVPPGLCYGLASQVFGLQYPLDRLVSADQHEVLDRAATGEILLCHASTEEASGSDPLQMGTVARRHADGHFVLDGTKSYVTSAPVADIALVFARTGEPRSPFGLSAFLVDLASVGVSRTAPVSKTALVGIPMGSIRFDGVAVPADRLVGDVGAGLQILRTTTSWERGLLLSYALGPMRLLLQSIVEWSASRRHFGRAMGASHLVAGRVADIALRVHRSRTLVYSVAARLDGGESIGRLAAETALTKISVTEDYAALTQQAAALSGVRAYIEDSPLVADPASALAGMTYAGSNDLLRVLVARDLGLPVVS